MRLTTIIALFISTSAFACPNLAGKYASCRSTTGASAGQTDMIVTQSVQNRTTIYKVSAINNATSERETEVYRADGKTHKEVITDPESGMTITTSSTVGCINNTLNIRMELDLMGEPSAYAQINVRKSGKQIIVESKGSDGEEEYSNTEICE